MYFELPKIPSSFDGNNLLECWLSLFNANTESDLQKMERLGVPEMSKAVKEYRRVVVSDEFTELERLREKAHFDGNAAIGNARRQADKKWAAVVSEKDAVISDKDAALSEKDATIAELEAELAKYRAK
jgi:hypothetical protein